MSVDILAYGFDAYHHLWKVPHAEVISVRSSANPLPGTAQFFDREGRLDLNHVVRVPVRMPNGFPFRAPGGMIKRVGEPE